MIGNKHIRLLIDGKKFLLVHFFGHILDRNNQTFTKTRILRKEYFNRSRFCFLDLTITSYLEKYFCEFIHV
jgi:hypothetical protein